MAGDVQLVTAIRKLEQALSALDDAVEGRAEADRRRSDLEVEIQRLAADRSRLAQALDGAEARAARLEEANREVSRRLVAAMESIRALMDEPGAAG